MSPLAGCVTDLRWTTWAASASARRSYRGRSAGSPWRGAAIAAALAGSLTAGVRDASASTGEKVIVTATGLLSPAAAVIGVGGALLTQFHLIDGVEAVIPAAIEPVLAALPGITVTPDVSVSVRDMPESTGPYAF